MKATLPALLITLLAGCAAQQPITTAPEAGQSGLTQRLTDLEAKNQTAQNLIGELGQKVASLSAKLASQTAALQTKADAGQIDRLSAQRQLAESDQTQTRLAENAELAERIDDLADQLDGVKHQDADLAALSRSNEYLARQIEALNAQLRLSDGEQAQTLKAEAHSIGQRIDQLGAHLESLRSAQTANHDAHAARISALERRVDELSRNMDDVLAALGLGQRKILGKVVEAITLTDDKTLFPINSPELGEADKAKLNALGLRLKALGTYYHLQIQGHTDGIGGDDYNFLLGRARAEAVRNYLNEKLGIPLLRMSVQSFGAMEAKGYGTGSNRRIVVQVVQ